MKTDAYANTAIIMVSGLVCLALTLSAIWIVSANRKPDNQKSVAIPAFRDHEFGKTLTVTESMKLVKEDGLEKKYAEKVDGDDIDAIASYETVDGILYAATLSYKKPYDFVMESALRDKLGPPQDYKPDRQEWKFDDGNITHYSGFVDYRTGYCSDYFSEQKKKRNDKVNEAL